MNNSWEVIIEADEYGELVLPFPLQLIRENNWLAGDEIEFEIKDDYVLIINRTAKMRENENGFG